MQEDRETSNFIDQVKEPLQLFMTKWLPSQNWKWITCMMRLLCVFFCRACFSATVHVWDWLCIASGFLHISDNK